jgi:CMP-N-acetylneuraminic acid synthetase
MFENILAIIPCRAGSQRFPGKNMALFNGLPLVIHKVHQAREAGLTNIIVTTDSYNIKKAIANEPIWVLDRMPHLCGPKSSQEDVIADAIPQAEEMGLEFDTFCSLQVTSPTLAVGSLVDALHKFQQNSRYSSMAAVTEAYQPSGGFHIVNKDLFLENHSLYQEGGSVYILPPAQCIDIDYRYQLEIAKCNYIFGLRRGSCSCSK